MIDAAIRTATDYFSKLVIVHAWHLQGESFFTQGATRVPSETLQKLRQEKQRLHQDWLDSYAKGYISKQGPESVRYLKSDMRLINGLTTEALDRQHGREPRQRAWQLNVDRQTGKFQIATDGLKRA